MFNIDETEIYSRNNICKFFWVDLFGFFFNREWKNNKQEQEQV